MMFLRVCHCQVYPRVCGGTGQANLVTIGGDGLSPRVRGNLAQHRNGERRLGSIPACAGEPLSLSRTTRRCAVYPRVCGGTSVNVRRPLAG